MIKFFNHPKYYSAIQTFIHLIDSYHFTASSRLHALSAAVALSISTITIIYIYIRNSSIYKWSLVIFIKGDFPLVLAQPYVAAYFIRVNFAEKFRFSYQGHAHCRMLPVPRSFFFCCTYRSIYLLLFACDLTPPASTMCFGVDDAWDDDDDDAAQSFVTLYI